MGIRLDSFGKQLEQQHGYQVGGAFKVHSDGTSLRQWHYVFAKRFALVDTTRSPDHVIITFINDHLADQTDSRWRRMALNVVGNRQVAEVLCHDVSSFEDGAYFLAAHFLGLVAYQSTIKNRVLSRIIPDYATETQRLNRVRRAHLKVKAHQREPKEKASFTYSWLQEFIDMLDECGSHGVFCLMPLPNEQSVDSKLVKTIESNNMTFFDFRDLASQTKGHYPDGYHMDLVAADIYSRALADALAERHPEIFSVTEPKLPSVQNELPSSVKAQD